MKGVLAVVKGEEGAMVAAGEGEAAGPRRVRAAAAAMTAPEVSQARKSAPPKH